MTSGLHFVFGSGIDGCSWKDAVQQCVWGFVRSRSQLALNRPEQNPAGHKLTAWEAWDAYGREVISEAIEHSGAVLKRTEQTVEGSLLECCKHLGIPWSTVAAGAGLSSEEVAMDEVRPRPLPIRALGAVAFALGLDERFLSFNFGCIGDSGFADRLSELRQLPDEDPNRISGATVAAVAEAVSVMRVQNRLQTWLGKGSWATGFAECDEYGSDGAGARQVGYRLADDLRMSLGLGVEPVSSMRDLVEDRLGIPIVSTELPAGVAGGTVSCKDNDGNEFRGVLVNSVGKNEDVWTRRVNLARELGHALLDPPDRVQFVQIDRSLDEDSVEGLSQDKVKQRADAFALAFLAPMDEVRRRVPEFPVHSDQVGQVMRHFGMSESAARRRIASCYSWEAPEVPAAPLWVRPTQRELQAENLVWAGSLPCAVRESRRGRFAEVVLDCYKSPLISGDTAALYLGCSAEEIAGSATASGA